MFLEMHNLTQTEQHDMLEYSTTNRNAKQTEANREIKKRRVRQFYTILKITPFVAHNLAIVKEGTRGCMHT